MCSDDSRTENIAGFVLAIFAFFCWVIFCVVIGVCFAPKGGGWWSIVGGVRIALGCAIFSGGVFGGQSIVSEGQPNLGSLVMVASFCLGFSLLIWPFIF